MKEAFYKTGVCEKKSKEKFSEKLISEIQKLKKEMYYYSFSEMKEKENDTIKKYYFLSKLKSYFELKNKATEWNFLKDNINKKNIWVKLRVAYLVSLEKIKKVLKDQLKNKGNILTSRAKLVKSYNQFKKAGGVLGLNKPILENHINRLVFYSDKVKDKVFKEKAEHLKVNLKDSLKHFERIENVMNRTFLKKKMFYCT